MVASSASAAFTGQRCRERLDRRTSHCRISSRDDHGQVFAEEVRKAFGSARLCRYPAVEGACSCTPSMHGSKPCGRVCAKRTSAERPKLSFCQLCLLVQTRKSSCLGVLHRPHLKLQGIPPTFNLCTRHSVLPYERSCAPALRWHWMLIRVMPA